MGVDTKKRENIGRDNDREHSQKSEATEVKSYDFPNKNLVKLLLTEFMILVKTKAG